MKSRTMTLRGRQGHAEGIVLSNSQYGQLGKISHTASQRHDLFHSQSNFGQGYA